VCLVGREVPLQAQVEPYLYVVSLVELVAPCGGELHVHVVGDGGSQVEVGGVPGEIERGAEVLVAFPAAPVEGDVGCRERGRALPVGQVAVYGEGRKGFRNV